MKHDFDSVYLGKIDPVLVESEPRLGVSDGIVPAFTLEARETRGFARFATSPESFESKVYTYLSILKNLGKHLFKLWFTSFPLREFVSRVVERYRLFLGLPSILSKRKSLIVDPASQLQDVVHLGYLKLRRI
jgi:hypothetical protein